MGYGGGFAPAIDDRARVGSPEGLNPFGATMAPDLQRGAPPGVPPGGMPPGMQPGGPPPGGPPPGGAQGGPPRWSDPAAFAATAPPPTGEEHEAAMRAQNAQIVEPPRPQSPSVPPAQAPAAPAPQAAVDPEQVAPDAPRVLAGFIISYEGNELGAFWPLHQGRNVIGRKGAMEGLDIELDHPTTSSRHAVILAAARPGRLKLEDPGSTNGTFINEQRIENTTQHELKDGDRVRFGGYTCVVKIV